MKGYLRVASIMPNIKVGNPTYNLNFIKDDILKANTLNVKLCVLPELCITGSNLKSLFYDKNILNESLNSLFSLLTFSSELDITIVVSLPFEYNNKIYDVAAVIKSGDILGFVPKNDFKESINKDYFSKFDSDIENIVLYDRDRNIKYEFPFSKNILFECNTFNFSVIYDTNNKDLINSNIYINLFSIPETINVDSEIKKVKELSNDTNSIVITSSPGPSESTDRYSYFGRSLVVEDGIILSKNDIITNHILISDIDLDKSNFKNNNYNYISNYKTVNFSYSNFFDNDILNKLFRDFNKTPFIKKNVNPYKYSLHIINIISVALAKRMNAINCKDIVIGISGGLDSTLALLICKKTIEFLSLNNDSIHAYSMPGFGTTNLTNKNTIDLLKSLDIKLNTIDIINAMNVHFNDIKHDINNTNVTFENAQARERTQILMDIANDVNGIVVGTGDLSEIALGFSTYNGDRMSMYNVNAPIPKTLIKYILNAIAEENLKEKNNILLANTLKNILHMPISPELLPTENGVLIQKTEEILGSYEIHDFILYNYLKYHFDIEKIYDLALRTFVFNSNNNSHYTDEYIKNCVNIFFDRFFKSNYKRTASADSIDIGLPSLNTNFDFKMPNDSEISFKLK